MPKKEEASKLFKLIEPCCNTGNKVACNNIFFFPFFFPSVCYEFMGKVKRRLSPASWELGSKKGVLLLILIELLLYISRF